MEPITTTGNMSLDDLIGYESQKQKLIENTEAFVKGKKANNVLLLVMRVQANLQASRQF